MAGGRPSRRRAPRRARRSSTAPRPRSGSARGRRCAPCRRRSSRRWPSVSSSRRPRRIAAIALAAARIALRPSSGRMPGVGGGADELGLEAQVGRRRHDHLADRRRVVEDEAELGAQLTSVERRGALEPGLLRDREQRPRARPASPRRSPRRSSSTTTATAALLSAPRIASLRLLHWPSSQTGSIAMPSCGTVSMCVHSSTLRSPRPPSAGQQVAARESGVTSMPIVRSSAVSQSATACSWPDGLGIAHSAANVSASRVRSRGASRTHASTRTVATRPRPARRRSPAWRWAAATNSRNSGAGRSGRDLNSGWNCEATKNGWSAQLDDLDQALVGRRAGDDEPRRLEALAQRDRDLIAVAVALVDDRLAVAARGPGCRRGA